MLLATTSCIVDKYNSFTENIEIVNHSSSRVAGFVFMTMGSFDLAPGDSFSTAFNAERKGNYPTVYDVSESGPMELTVDGKLYRLKSTVNAQGFFDIYGWDVTQVEKGFDLKMELTDEGLEKLLSHADLVE